MDSDDGGGNDTVPDAGDPRANGSDGGARVSDAGHVATADGGDADAGPGIAPTDGGACTSACATGATCTDGQTCISQVCDASGLCAAPSPGDGVMNDSETDVDCGGGASTTTDGALACGPGLHCLVATDCTSNVCTGAVAASGGTAAIAGVCQAPSCSDQVKNGFETGVDCGGGACKTCPVGAACGSASDCASKACNYASVCVSAPSCTGQAGGDTCGPGEVGDANAKHEDCCQAINVPRPAASGGPFLLDKYLITAGRMRAFLEAVSYNVQAYIAQNTPAWWPTGANATTWNNMLPSSHDDFIYLTTTKSEGCVVGTQTNAYGAPAYWETPDDLAKVFGAPRTYTKDEMDTKVMNCFKAPLFHALCAYDGGRLPSRTEWIAARTTWDVKGVATVPPAPWANDGAAYGSMADRESHATYDTRGDENYFWPSVPTTNDQGSLLGAPGRFPSGNGPYGHSDLLGSVENMGSQPDTGVTVKGDGWFQFSWQEPEQNGIGGEPTHPYGQQYVGFGTGAYEAHLAVGARCVKLP